MRGGGGGARNELLSRNFDKVADFGFKRLPPPQALTRQLQH